MSPAPGARPTRTVLRLRLLPESAPSARALGISLGGHLLVLVALAVAAWMKPALPPRLDVQLVAAELREAGPARHRASPHPAAPQSSPRARVTPPPPPEEIPLGPLQRHETKPPPPRHRSAPSPPAESSAPESAPAPAADAPDPGASGEDVKATVDGAGIADEYLARLVARVSSQWLKPQFGLPARSAILYFELGRDGRVSAARVEISSGVGSYDLAAQRALERAEPLPPPPPSYPAPVLKVHFEFIP